MIPLRDSVPVHRWPIVTWLLIGMNVWAFFSAVVSAARRHGRR